MTNDRYERMRGILPMEPLQGALAIVGGAGALGNEVLKNLTLLGVGNVVVCDLDTVEIHNLTRSVLYRQTDTGQMKADVAAARIRDLNPDVNAIAFPDNIAELGGGFFRRASLVFSTFDAYYPRYVINEMCMRYGKPWVDGGMSALEHHRGGVTLYDGSDPQAFCYACGTSPETVSSRLAAMRGFLGCTVYENVTGEMGGVPTTPMMASVIGGIQTAAALDLFYSRLDRSRRCSWPFGSWELDIRELAQRRVKRRKVDGCYHHETVEYLEPKIIEIPGWDSTRNTYRDVLDRAREEFGTRRVAVEPPDDIYSVGTCGKCKAPWEFFRLRSTYTAREKSLACPACGAVGSLVIDGAHMDGLIDYDWEFIDRPLADVGCRPLDVLTVTKYDNLGVPEAHRYWEVSGDAARFGLPVNAYPSVTASPTAEDG